MLINCNEISEYQTEYSDNIELRVQRKLLLILNNLRYENTLSWNVQPEQDTVWLIIIYDHCSIIVRV